MTTNSRQTIGRKRLNLKDDVEAYLRNEILRGNLRPGARIRQDDVAEELDVSKLPVREAIITLEAEGLVENVPRRGAYVARLTPDDIRDHFAIYGAVAALATRRAATALTSGQLDELERLAQQIDASTTIGEGEQHNDRFHRLINRAGTSRRLRLILSQLAQTIPVQFVNENHSWPEWTYQDHIRIVAAFRDQDPDKAAAIMQEHLERGGEQTVEALAKEGFWAEL